MSKNSENRVGGWGIKVSFARIYESDMRFHPTIPYYHVFYEELIGSHKNLHWTLIQTFLQIKILDEKNMNLYKEEDYTKEKLHKLPCYQRIENWKSIQHLFEDTNSYYACDLDASRL